MLENIESDHLWMFGKQKALELKSWQIILWMEQLDMLGSFEHFMVLRLFEDDGFHDDELLLLDFNITWHIGHFVHPFPDVTDAVSGLDNIQDSHGDGVFVFVWNSVQHDFPQGILFLFFLHLLNGLDIEN